MQLLYFGLVLCFISIPLLFLSLYRWYQARKNKRAPFSDAFLRSPGQSLNDKIQNISDEINIYYGYVMTLPIFILSTAFIYKIDLIYSILIIALVELLLFKRLWQYLNERRDYRLGYDGEVAVGQELNLLMLDGYHVFHDLVSDKIKKFNIDHIIVGSSGVYAVETKTRSKSRLDKGKEKSTVYFEGDALQFPKYSDTASLTQARLNAIHLQKWLTSAVGEQVNVEAILTIPGWFVGRKALPRGVNVLNPKQIRGFLKGQKEKPLSDSMVKRIVHQLDQRCRNVEPFTVQMEMEDRKKAEGV